MKLVSVFLISSALIACRPESGGRDYPIASRDGAFSPDLADDLTSHSRSFAQHNGLAFENRRQGADRILTLHNDQIRIEATLQDSRLKIVALGPVTEGSINLANQYMNEVTSIH